MSWYVFLDYVLSCLGHFRSLDCLKIENGSSWSSSARIGYLIMQFLGLSANLSSKQNMVWFLRTSKRKQQPFSWGADEAVA